MQYSGFSIWGCVDLDSSSRHAHPSHIFSSMISAMVTISKILISDKCMHCSWDLFVHNGLLDVVSLAGSSCLSMRHILTAHWWEIVTSFVVTFFAHFYLSFHERKHGTWTVFLQSTFEYSVFLNFFCFAMHLYLTLANIWKDCSKN